MALMTEGVERRNGVALVIGCGKQKIWSKLPSQGKTAAKEAYIGPLFRLSRKYAERYYPAGWFILSAHYGLMTPDYRIADYDSTFKAPGDERISMRKLRRQCRRLIGQHKIIVSLAGFEYSRFLGNVLAPDQKLELPLACLGLFARMKALAAAVSK
jgi:Family of unknown function (DUF6884)